MPKLKKEKKMDNNIAVYIYVGVCSLVAIWATIYAYRSEKQATKEAKEAEKAKKEASEKISVNKNP